MSLARLWLNDGTAAGHAHLTGFSDSRLLATCSTCHVLRGVFAVASRDKGRTQDLDHPVQLSLSNGFTVGWQVTLQAPDGSLVTTCAASGWLETVMPPVATTADRRDEKPGSPGVMGSSIRLRFVASGPVPVYPSSSTAS